MLPGGLTEDDFRILEFIASRDMVADPKTVAANLRDIEDQRIRNRLRLLLDRGMLKRPNDVPDGIDERGLYEATELGHTYARGEMTLNELREFLRERRDESG